MKTPKVQNYQIKQLYSLFSEDVKKDPALRQELIFHFTHGRVSSTKDLTDEEANRLIAALKGTYTHWGMFDKNNTQHLTLLRLCYDLNWTTFNKKHNRTVADLNTLGKFIASKKSPVRKPLLEMSVKECSKLITALEGILKFKYKKMD